MERKEYSAGMTKLSFWFSEFRKVIQLLNNGKTLLEIKKMNLEENIFSAPTQGRAILIFNTVSTRVKSLEQSFYTLFEQSDISNQKVIALIAVMQSDSLFFDFVYEVYREKLIIGANELSDSDFGIFFKDKQIIILTSRYNPTDASSPFFNNPHTIENFSNTFIPNFGFSLFNRFNI